MTKPYKCRVEYLESTGTQYIDTGVMGNGEFNIKYGLYANSIGSSSDIFAGARSSTQHLNFGQAASNGQFTLGYLNQYWQELSNFAINTRYDIEISYKSGEQYAIINGTKGSSKTYTGIEQTDLTIYLFKRHHYGTDNVGGLQGRIYYFTIKQNDVLVRDFIPVLDNSGRPAMYDQVSGQLFYNQGSGEFTYGRQIIPVEYLESTGTQYIDTGIKGKNNLHYKTKVNFTTLSTSGSNGIGGEYLANASAYIGMVRANGHYTYLFNNTAVETTTTIYANTDYEIDSVMNSGSQVLRVNGETISNGTLSGTFTSTRNIFLYAVCSTNDAADVYGSLKMYYCQIYDNDTLVRDFIPCIDENLVPFMFDKVQNTVYLNAGTGQFKVGPNVKKAWGGKKLRRKLALALANLKKKRKYYCEVEFLQNKTTSDYISTGIYYDWSKNATVNTVFSIPSLGLRYVIAGSYAGSGLNLEVSENGRCRMYGNGGTPNVFTTQTIQANEKVEIIFKRNYPDTEMTVITPRWTETVSLANVTQTAVSATTLNLFRDTRASFGLPIIYKFYIKMGDLEKDFIPVLDWDYHPCMYEKNTSEFYYDENPSDMYGFTAGREIHYVDYLESTGEQYIDTGLNYFADFEVGIKLRNNVSNKALGNTQTNCMERNNATSHNWRFSSNGFWDSNIDLLEYHVMKWKEDKIYADDVLLTEKVKIKNTGYYMTLFGAGAYYPNMIYFCKLWNPDDGTLVRNYIPAIDENGVGFLFDKVSHTIYDNAGTGAFGYSGREVEYLESDGARAIFAGITVDDTCGYDVKWMALNADDRIIMGTKGSGESRWVLSGSNNPNVNLSWNTNYGSNGLGLNKIQTAQMNYFNDRKRILNDTPLEDITQTLSTYASTYNVGIFAGYWGATTISLYSTCRIYYVKISKGTELIRDFIPMIKDGSPCLYDKVGGEYYFGIGTGSFTVGRILEEEYE